MDSAVTYLGNTKLKGQSVEFGIKDDDRAHHLCILGKAGSGRSDLSTAMALQDIERGGGVLVLDATGDVAPALMERIDPAESDRLVYLDPAEAEYPYSWNPLDDIRALPEDAQVQRLTELLSAVYRVPVSPLTREGARLLLEDTESTIVSFFSLATNARARKGFLEGREEAAAPFEHALETEKEAVAAIEDGGRYIAKDTLVRNLLGQYTSKFNLKSIATDQIVIVDLSRIRMFPTRITPLVRTFVEGARAAGLGAHQPTRVYLHDCLRYLGEEEIERTFSDQHILVTTTDATVQEADRERRLKALKRCGSVVSFAPHPSDRSLIEHTFYPYVDPDEVLELEPGEMVVALTIDAVRAKPFLARALALPQARHASYQDLMLTSRQRYTTARSSVDALFRPRPQDDQMGPPGGAGFADAFRSIFARKAQNGSGAPPAPQSPAPPPQVQKAPQKEPSKEPPKKAAAPPEVPEDTLKNMLYVAPV